MKNTSRDEREERCYLCDVCVIIVSTEEDHDREIVLMLADHICRKSNSSSLQPTFFQYFV